jgi:hypothetical protein
MQTANRFGGHLLFTEEPEHPTSPVEGAQMYWDSDAHQAFGPTYFTTVSLTEEGRGAATVQVCGHFLCADFFFCSSFFFLLVCGHFLCADTSFDPNLNT